MNFKTNSTELAYIKSLATVRNLDSDQTGTGFLHTHSVGLYHYVTVFRKPDDRAYTYIIHDSNHNPKREYIRTHDYNAFEQALEKIDAMSEREYEHTFTGHDD